MAPPNNKKPSKQEINDLGAELGVTLSKAIVSSVRKALSTANFSGLNKALITGMGTLDVSKALDISKVGKAVSAVFQPRKINLVDYVDFAGVSEGLAEALQPQPITPAQATTPPPTPPPVAPTVEMPTIAAQTASVTLQPNKIGLMDYVDFSKVNDTLIEALTPSTIKVVDYMDFSEIESSLNDALQISPVNLVPPPPPQQGTLSAPTTPTQSTPPPAFATAPPPSPLKGPKPELSSDLSGQFMDTNIVDEALQMQQQRLSMQSDLSVIWDQVNQKAEWYGDLLGQSKDEQAGSIKNLLQTRDLTNQIVKGMQTEAVARKLAETSTANQLAVVASVIKLQEQEWSMAQDYAELLAQQLAVKIQSEEGLTGIHAAQAVEYSLLEAKGLLTKEQLAIGIDQLKVQQGIHQAGIEGVEQLEAEIARRTELIKLNKEYGSQHKIHNDLHSHLLNIDEKLFEAGLKYASVQKDISSMAETELQGVGDLLLKKNMVTTGLKGDYAQLLTTFMLENNITDATSEQAAALVEQLKARQHNNDHLKHQVELYESLASWQLELIEELEEYSKGWEKIKSKVLAVVSDPKILKSFLSVKGLEVLKEGLDETKEIFSEFRAEGMTFAQSLSESQVALGSIFSLSGASLKENAQIQGALVKEMGSMDNVTRDTVVSAGKLSKTFGISAQMAGQITGQLANLPGSTAESAAESLQFAGALAKAAHVAPGAVIAEMAQNSEAMATYTKAGGKNVEIAAVAAKKLGIEFGAVTKMADGLLDFENSINKQMEASVLLGREINLDKARELAFNGDLVGATQEMLRNVGGEVEFNKMSVLHRRALAESMGVSVQDLAKMVKNQDKLNTLTQEQQTALSEGAGWDEVLGQAEGISSRLWDGVTATGALVINARGIVSGFKEGVNTIGDMWSGFKEGTDLMSKTKGAVEGFFGKAAQAVPSASPLPAEAPSIPTPARTLDTSSEMADKSAKLGKAAEAGPKAKSGQGIKDFLHNLSSGLKSMAGGNVLLGALNMIPASVGLIAMIPGALGAKVLELIRGERLQQSLQGLAQGLESMGKGRVALGALVMIPASLGFVAMTAGAIGLAAVALLGVPAGVGLTGLASGLTALGAGGVFKGVLAIGLLGASLIPAAYAFSLLSEVDTSKIIAFSIAVPLLGVAAAGLGLVAPLIGVGALALAAVGASMAVIAGGMLLLKQAEGGFDTLESFLQSIMGNATAIPLIGLLGLSLAGLGLSSLVAIPGIMLLNLVLPSLAGSVMFLGAASQMLQGDLTAVVDQLGSMVSLVPGLYEVGGGLSSIAAGLGAIALAGLAALPALVGLNAMPSLIAQPTPVAAVETSEATPQSKAANSDNKGVESKLDLLIEEVKTLIQVASKGGVVNMDGKKVGEVVRLALNSSGMR